MIIIEPIGQTENRYPRTEPAPIVVPKIPEISPEWKQYQPPEKKSSFWLLVLLGGIYAAVKYSGSPAPLGEALPKKRRGKRLYYMWKAAGKGWEESISIPKKDLPIYQMQTEKKRGKLVYLWSDSADDARHELYSNPAARSAIWSRPPSEREAPSPEAEQLPLFSGRYSNCGLWQEVPSYRSKRGFAWRCLQYGPACDPQQPDGEMCVTDPPLEKLKQRVKCKNYQLVSSAHYGKPVKRCKSYEAICTTRACLTERTPVPELEPEPEEPTESEVRAVAEWMAETEWEKRSAVDAKSLAREILSRGGIRAYRKQYPGQKTDEEYMEIPLFLKKKTGLPPDEMADEMGYDTDSDLYADIHAAYPAKTPQTALQKKMARRKPRWEDFRDRAFILLMEEKHGSIGFGQAEGVRDVTRRTFEKWITTGKAKRQYDHGLRTVYLIDGKLYQVDFGQHYSRIAPLSGVGQEQEELWKLKRELVLEPEDIATSDDPLEICLQRKGWDLRRVSELQASIADKMTPDLFTGKKTPLSPSEKDLQQYIDECYKRMAQARATGKQEQMTLFGAGCRDKEGHFVPVAQCTGRRKISQEPQGKKAWEMTNEAWDIELQRRHKESIKEWNAAGGKGLPPPLRINTVAERISLAERAGYQLPRDADIVKGLQYHRLNVEAAIAEGRDVPPEVIEQYPELSTKAEPQGKEPWQMTKAEFWREHETEWRRGKQFLDKEIQLTRLRRQAIRDAIDEGKAVPKKILAEYPDLEARAAGTTKAWKVTKTADELRAMELRRDRGGFAAYVDWSNPQTMVLDWEEFAAYPVYRPDGYPRRLVSRKDIEKGSRAEERPGFGGAGCRDRDGKFVPVPQCVGKVKITEIPVITNPAVGPVGLASLEGAPAYVWKSTLKRRR